MRFRKPGQRCRRSSPQRPLAVIQQSDQFVEPPGMVHNSPDDLRGPQLRQRNAVLLAVSSDPAMSSCLDHSFLPARIRIIPGKPGRRIERFALIFIGILCLSAKSFRKPFVSGFGSLFPDVPAHHPPFAYRLVDEVRACSVAVTGKGVLQRLLPRLDA